MILQEFFPNQGAFHDVTDETSDTLGHLYPRVAGFRLNYVVNPNNTETMSDLSSSPADRTILKFLRRQSDLILTTGATARQENLNSSVFAPMLIITRSDAELNIPALQKTSTKRIFITQRLDTEYLNTRAIAIGKIEHSASEFCVSFIQLNEFSCVVLESGITVAAEFATKQLLSEIDLTVTGVKSELEAELVAAQFLKELGNPTLDTLQLLNHEDNWFFRFGSL